MPIADPRGPAIGRKVVPGMTNEPQPTLQPKDSAHTASGESLRRRCEEPVDEDVLFMVYSSEYLGVYLPDISELMVRQIPSGSMGFEAYAFIPQSSAFCMSFISSLAVSATIGTAAFAGSDMARIAAVAS